MHGGEGMRNRLARLTSRFRLSTLAALAPLLLTFMPSHPARAEGFIREAFHRVFVPLDQFKATVRFYMAATQGRCSMYFPFPERKLELAAVSSPQASFLIIAGEPAALERFRSTAVTFHVFDLAAALKAAVGAGAALIQERTVVPTGVQARLRFPDGLIVEYVEHNEAAKRFYQCDALQLGN
jgi:predicted enzyme related to lactoylglutathione lyase